MGKGGHTEDVEFNERRTGSRSGAVSLPRPLGHLSPLPRSHPLPPAPLPRSLVCLLGTCKQVALMLELGARRRRRHLTRSLIHCVRPSARVRPRCVCPSKRTQLYSLHTSLARSRSSCRRRRRPDATRTLLGRGNPATAGRVGEGERGRDSGRERREGRDGGREAEGC